MLEDSSIIFFKHFLKISMDILEVYLPSLLFIVMFASFVIGIIFRYVIKNPLQWTFELVIISFIIVGLLSCCFTDRKEKHVIFDLIYSKLQQKDQTTCRIISNIFLMVVFSIAIPPTIKYLLRMQQQAMVTSIIRIPLCLVFAPFAILYIVTVLRSGYRLFLDIMLINNKKYIKQDNVDKKELLI